MYIVLWSWFCYLVVCCVCFILFVSLCFLFCCLAFDCVVEWLLFIVDCASLCCCVCFACCLVVVDVVLWYNVWFVVGVMSCVWFD